MSEPPKEQIEEARNLRSRCGEGYLNSPEITRRLAVELAEVRTKAHNGALERCANLCEKARPTGGRAWEEAQTACFDALTHVAQCIRAMKEPA